MTASNIISNYNNTIHRTIKAKPIEVFNQDALNKQKIIMIKHMLQIGDQVRIKIVKQVFDKGDRITHSKEIYTIIEKIKNKFKIKNDDNEDTLKRLFKPYELVKVNQIQYLERGSEETVNEETIHNNEKRDRKIKRAMKKDGMEPSLEPRATRKRIPKRLDEYEYD